MASLLSRIGQGLGAGLQQMGTMGMEEKREKRLAKVRDASALKRQESGQEFTAGEAQLGRESRASESELSRAFTGSENAKDRQARLKAAGAKGAKPDTVKSTSIDELTGRETITYQSGKQTEYDPETDSYSTRGEGEGRASEGSKAEDAEWGRTMANREAGMFSGDTADFPQFKSETKAAEAAARFRSNARKAGTLDEFDTEFAKKGFSYVQELGGGTPTATAKSTKAATSLMNIFKDFDEKEYNGIANQVANDPNAPAALKQEALDYLSTGTPTEKAPAKAKAKAAPKQKFTDKENWWLEPDVPTEARKKMTKEMWQERAENVESMRATSASEEGTLRKQVAEELETIVPTLSREERLKWITKFGDVLTSAQRKKVLA